MAVTFIALGMAGAVPWWLVALIFGRDIMILFGAALLYSRVRQRKFPPTMAGKVSTTLQILAAGFIMLAKSDAIASWWIPTAIAATTAGTLWSGLDYIIRGRAMLRGEFPDS
jgi:cardiolipin synthase